MSGNRLNSWDRLRMCRKAFSSRHTVWTRKDVFFSSFRNETCAVSNFNHLADVESFV